MDEDDGFEDAGTGTPLSAIAEAFEELSSNHDLMLKPFCHACSLLSVLFGSLGIAFKFAELEYVSKVRDLTEASEIFGSLNSILDYDVRNDTSLYSDDSLKEAASMAYAKVCAPYHTWAVRTAVSAGMCALPTRDQLLIKLNETDDSAEREMRRYIDASLPIIEYIDKLYISRNVSLDW
ncbi:ACD11 homolog protein isoform X2 [Solanum lycopersicum]|uniref:ACD11 homolog protein isoform X2 n=1 Tax=Solanum lycopersicum TaxID=4081 RepID=UPI0008FEB60E|nr:ACD11 homolog protein isoform X2 [Solanum lycopersicum]